MFCNHYSQILSRFTDSPFVAADIQTKPTEISGRFGSDDCNARAVFANPAAEMPAEVYLSSHAAVPSAYAFVQDAMIKTEPVIERPTLDPATENKRDTNIERLSPAKHPSSHKTTWDRSAHTSPCRNRQSSTLSRKLLKNIATIVLEGKADSQSLPIRGRISMSTNLLTFAKVTKFVRCPHNPLSW